MNVFLNATTIDAAREVLSIVDLGLCSDLGNPIHGHMCVRSAVCYALGMPYEVDPALRLFGMMLNGSSWSSPGAHGEGMRKLAVAQLGSLGQIDAIKFAQKLAEQTIRQILPPLLRQIKLNDVANRCEQEGTDEAANAACFAACCAPARDTAAGADAARYTVEAAYAAYRAALAARKAAARYADDGYANVFLAAHSAAYTAYAANAAAYAAYAATSSATLAVRDGVLLHMIDICIGVLREMRAPGIALMDQVC